MQKTKKKIVLTNWINLIAILTIWLFENIIKIDFLNIGLISFFEEILQGLTQFFSTGFFIMIPLLLIVIFIDLIVWSRDYATWKILILEWIVLSSPFVYWFFRHEQQRVVNLSIILILLIFQWFRSVEIKKIRHTE